LLSLRSKTNSKWKREEYIIPRWPKVNRQKYGQKSGLIGLEPRRLSWLSLL
jgi:hypothetical protein